MARSTSGSDTDQDITPRLISRFKALLSDGTLAPGQKLPSERELAKRFEVSRASLRPALKVLETMGVIRQRVGDGTYVTTEPLGILSEPLEFLVLVDDISYHELLETRLIVEPHLAALAAERATARDLEPLERSLEEMKAALGDTEAIFRADVAFHAGIYSAAGNRLCERFFGVLHRAYLESIRTTSKFNVPEAIFRSHELIYEAIRDRRPDDARQRMTEHLIWGRDALFAENASEKGKKRPRDRALSA